MGNQLKRLERLHEAHKAKLNKPVAIRWLDVDTENATAADIEALAKAKRDAMVEAGEIRADQRKRVMMVRWMTTEELQQASHTVLMRPSES